jgi:hypothetical protein
LPVSSNREKRRRRTGKLSSPLISFARCQKNNRKKKESAKHDKYHITRGAQRPVRLFFFSSFLFFFFLFCRRGVSESKSSLCMRLFDTSARPTSGAMVPRCRRPRMRAQGASGAELAKKNDRTIVSKRTADLRFFEVTAFFFLSGFCTRAQANSQPCLRRPPAR